MGNPIRYSASHAESDALRVVHVLQAAMPGWMTVHEIRVATSTDGEPEHGIENVRGRVSEAKLKLGYDILSRRGEHGGAEYRLVRNQPSSERVLSHGGTWTHCSRLGLQLRLNASANGSLTKEQQAELESEVRGVLEGFARRHGLSLARPPLHAPTNPPEPVGLLGEGLTASPKFTDPFDWLDDLEPHHGL